DYPGRAPARRLFFSSRRRHTRSKRDWSSDVCSSDLPLATPEPEPLEAPSAVINGTAPSTSAMAVYGSHTAQASTWPDSKALLESEGCKKLISRSPVSTPAYYNCKMRWPCALTRRATATLFPFRSATDLMSEPCGMRMASPFASLLYAERTFVSVSPPTMGGVLPVMAKSICPAFSASICGGPEVNVDHVMS